MSRRYDEIVEAKLDMMRQMSPAASGVLIDAYYGAFPAIAMTGAMPAEPRGCWFGSRSRAAAKNAVRWPDG